MRIGPQTSAANAIILGGVQAAEDEWPNENNTGPTGELTSVSGSLTVSVNGTIVQNQERTGTITVNADNVTIRNYKIISTGASAIFNNGTNLLVEDVEIDMGSTVGRTGITPANYTARRCNVYGGENLFWAEDNVLIEDCYIHDTVPYNPIDDPHTDGVQIPGSATNITLRHNTIYGGYVDDDEFGNSAFTTGGSCTDILIEDNLLAGGGHCARCEGSGANTNFRVINNRFSRIFDETVGGFGPVSGCDGSGGWPGITEWSGNVYHETGLPV